MFSRLLKYFGGGGQNIYGKVGVFVWRDAPCSACTQSHAFAREFGGMPPKKIFLNGAIWCDGEYFAKIL